MNRSASATPCKERTRNILEDLFGKREKQFKVMLKLTSHGLLRYLWSADLSKSFFQLIMSIFIFFQYFFSIDFAQWKSVGLLGYFTLFI